MTPERIEIVPSDDAVSRVRAALPRGAALSVTALPRHAIGSTVAVSAELAADGYDVVAHLAATRIVDRSALARILDRLVDSAVTGLFVVGGDGDRSATSFRDGGELLEEIRERTGRRFLIGAAAYPEGHPALSARAALEVLLGKEAYADYAVTQMCFDAGALVRFLVDARSDGLTLPVWLGVPGRVRLRALLGVAGRTGVGASLSFLSKGDNLRLLGRFDASAFRAAVEARAAEIPVGVDGFHVYSFNDLAPEDG